MEHPDTHDALAAPQGDAPREITGRPRREARIDLLVGALVQGASVPEAAKVANLSRAGAYELLGRDEIKDRPRAVRADALAGAAARAAGAAERVVGVLASLMDASKSDSVRRQAADSLQPHAIVLARDQEVEGSSAS